MPRSAGRHRAVKVNMQKTYRQILSTILFKCLELKHKIIIKFSQNEASVAERKNISEICLQKCKILGIETDVNTLSSLPRCQSAEDLVVRQHELGDWVLQVHQQIPAMPSSLPFSARYSSGVGPNTILAVWTWGSRTLWPLSYMERKQGTHWVLNNCDCFWIVKFCVLEFFFLNFNLKKESKAGLGLFWQNRECKH